MATFPHSLELKRPEQGCPGPFQCGKLGLPWLGRYGLRRFPRTVAGADHASPKRIEPVEPIQQRGKLIIAVRSRKIPSFRL